jgi:hypothetical protein
VSELDEKEIDRIRRMLKTCLKFARLLKQGNDPQFGRSFERAIKESQETFEDFIKYKEAK